MKNVLKIFVLIMTFLSAFSALAADLIKIRTINGVNVVPKQSIVEGPDGYLKSLFLHAETMKISPSDGSIFVYVDDEAMRYALAYIRHGSLPTKKMLSSPGLTKDFNFLLPGIKPKAKTKAKKIWECSAFCDYERIQAVIPISTTHVNITDAWQNLITLCGQRGQQTYLLRQKVHTVNDYLSSLASMRDSCVHRLRD